MLRIYQQSIRYEQSQVSCWLTNRDITNPLYTTLRLYRQVIRYEMSQVSCWLTDCDITNPSQTMLGSLFQHNLFDATNLSTINKIGRLTICLTGKSLIFIVVIIG